MKKNLLTLILFGFLINSVLIAQTYTFAGGGSTTQWHDAGNWSPSVLPRYCESPKYQHWETATIIDANADLTETAFHTCDFFFYEPHNPVTINSNKTLTIGGVWTDFKSSFIDFTVNGTFQSSGTVNMELGTMTIGSSGVFDIGLGLVIFNSSPTNNGIIKGVGTLQSTNIIGGNIKPGNSVGTLNTKNAITLSGTIEIEVNSASSFDKINSTNSTALTISSATVNFVFSGNNYYNGQTFQVFNSYSSVSNPASITNNNGYTIVHNGGGVFQITAGALPVELVDFSASLFVDKIKLKWQTASELNNEGFDVARSIDGKTWERLAFVAGHGTTHEEQSYSYTDERPQPGINYYRLRQMDFDGKSEYSKIVSVEMKNGGSGIHFFPNPATGSVTLALETDYSGEGTLTLYDLTGKQMQTATLSLESGAFRTDIGLGSLPTGVYMAQVRAGVLLWRERLIIK